MARTMRAINLDYSKAKAQAAKLEEIADELRSLARNSIEQGSDELLAGWRGENARMFASKELELAADVKKTAAEIDAVAKAIRTAARKIYEADKRAAEIARVAIQGLSDIGCSSGGGDGSLGGGGGSGGR